MLVDFVDEAFSLFFLVYRCMIGFAVLNDSERMLAVNLFPLLCGDVPCESSLFMSAAEPQVVNAVFVQQTLLMAANDEDLAFKQKQKDWALYTKKAPHVAWLLSLSVVEGFVSRLHLSSAGRKLTKADQCRVCRGKLRSQFNGAIMKCFFMTFRGLHAWSHRLSQRVQSCFQFLILFCKWKSAGAGAASVQRHGYFRGRHGHLFKTTDFCLARRS